MDSAGALFDFQERLAGEIIAAEPAAFRDKASPERRHIRLLRLLGDGLAWRFLHSYAIRQLGKLETPPPALSHQGAGFTSTVEIAREHASGGLPVLIADLTNCICVSDVVVCADPERPLLIESGGNARSLGGRKGRQLQRGLAVAQLLSRGHGKLLGDEHTTVTLPIDVEATYSWSEVAAATQAAMANGTGTAIASANDVIWAQVDGDEDPPIPHDAWDACESFKRSVALGVHLRLLEKPNARHQPPVVWPISFESRLALLEGDIYLCHAINIDAFLDDPGAPEPRIAEHRMRRDEITGFLAHGKAEESELSPLFLDDVLYGFQTIESVRETMLALVLNAETADMPTEDEDERPSGTTYVESRAEIRALASDPERREKIGTVSMPAEVFSEMEDLAREHGVPEMTSVVMGVEPSQARQRIPDAADRENDSGAPGS